MTLLRTVLFDLDGTLLDTAPDMAGALNQLRQERGLTPLPYELIRARVSHGAARLVHLGFPDADADTFAACQRRFLDIYAAALGAQTRLFEGMDRVLAVLAQRGLLCGIVTNKPEWLTLPLLRQLDLTSLFACVVSGDTVAERKPHPLPMLHAAKLAGVAAGECVYLGDAQRDIDAAHAAGMRGLVATYGYLEAGEDWQAWGGDGFIRSPLELLTWLDGGRP
jgi:phosphoglycolate phosphatase